MCASTSKQSRFSANHAKRIWRRHTGNSRDFFVAFSDKRIYTRLTIVADPDVKGLSYLKGTLEEVQGYPEILRRCQIRVALSPLFVAREEFGSWHYSVESTVKDASFRGLGVSHDYVYGVSSLDDVHLARVILSAINLTGDFEDMIEPQNFGDLVHHRRLRDLPADISYLDLSECVLQPARILLGATKIKNAIDGLTPILRKTVHFLRGRPDHWANLLDIIVFVAGFGCFSRQRSIGKSLLTYLLTDHGDIKVIEMPSLRTKCVGSRLTDVYYWKVRLTAIYLKLVPNIVISKARIGQREYEVHADLPVLPTALLHHINNKRRRPRRLQRVQQLHDDLCLKIENPDFQFPRRKFPRTTLMSMFGNKGHVFRSYEVFMTYYFYTVLSLYAIAAGSVEEAERQWRLRMDEFTRCFYFNLNPYAHATKMLVIRRVRRMRRPVPRRRYLRRRR